MVAPPAMISSGEELVHGAGAGADRVEQTRPLRHDNRRDAAADAVVEISHVHGVGLVLGLDALEVRLLGQRVEKGPDRAAGIAEIMPESGHLEPSGNRIDHAHFSFAP